MLHSLKKLKIMQNLRNYLQVSAQSGMARAWKLRRFLSQRGEYIFIACMPKSGSTFMANALSELTGYPYVNLTYAYERNEQNLYLPNLIDSYHFGSVTHLHMRATDSNIDIMNQFGIRPVVLVRNIFDVVISIRDHLFQEGFEFPTFYCNEKFSELGEQEQLNCIIELGLPWYFNFYVSWHEACSSGSVDALWLSYEEVVADWQEAIAAIAHFYKLERSEKEIEEALERTRSKKRSQTRLNKGIAGRGQTALTEAQKMKIVSMARFYPHIDFSKIGIPRSHVEEISVGSRKFNELSQDFIHES